MMAAPDPSTLPPESDFWDSPPRYSTVSELPVELPPQRRPSLRRLILARLLFVVILGAILAPIVYEASSLGWTRFWMLLGFGS
jgi:hypothetical protein